MIRPARDALALGLLLAFVGLGSHDARADTGAPAMGAPAAAAPPAGQPLDADVHVAYEFPASCPSAADFEREVQQRAPRAHFTGDTTARQFRVAAWTEAEEWVGEVTAVPVVDASSVRRVRGATCADVVGALALIVALALDPGALREPADTGEATAPQGAPAAPPEQQPRPAPPAVVAPPASPQPPPLPPPDDESSAELGHQRRVRLSFGAGALAALGIAPGTLFGAGFSVDLTPARDRLLAWLVRLSASALFPRDLGSPMKARFSGQFLALEGCPVRLPLGAVVSLLPCVGVEGGVLGVDGIDQPGLLSVQNQSALFLAIVQPLRFALRLGEAFSLEVDGTLKEPLRRDSFGYSRPPVHVYTLPSVTGSFGLGLRVNLDFL